MAAMHDISSLESLSAFRDFSQDHHHVADAEKARCRLTFIGSWAAGVLNADTPEVRAYKGQHHKSSEE